MGGCDQSKWLYMEKRIVVGKKLKARRQLSERKYQVTSIGRGKSKSLKYRNSRQIWRLKASSAWAAMYE